MDPSGVCGPALREALLCGEWVGHRMSAGLVRPQAGRWERQNNRCKGGCAGLPSLGMALTGRRCGDTPDGNDKTKSTHSFERALGPLRQHNHGSDRARSCPGVEGRACLTDPHPLDTSPLHKASLLSPPSHQRCLSLIFSVIAALTGVT